MQNKNALIIGGTSGIGLGMAEKLAERGLFIYSVGRRSMENASHQYSENIKFIKADISLSSHRELIKNSMRDIKLDYIVFSAATETPLKPFSKISETEYDYAFGVNLKAHFFLTQALIYHLNKNARLLLETFSAGLYKIFSGDVCVSCVTPGKVDTEMQSRLREADAQLFPQAHKYKKMRATLMSVSEASQGMVAHLCDTEDKDFMQSS